MAATLQIKLEIELQVCESSFGHVDSVMNRASGLRIKLQTCDRALERAVNRTYCTPGLPYYVLGPILVHVQ